MKIPITLGDPKPKPSKLELLKTCSLCGAGDMVRSIGSATFTNHKAPCGRDCVAGEQDPLKLEEPWHMGRSCDACLEH